jgi:hypothetical protein
MLSGELPGLVSMVNMLGLMQQIGAAPAPGQSEEVPR